MSHVRTQIKKAALVALRAQTGLENICHIDRDDEFAVEEMPAVNLHSIKSVEANEPLTMNRNGTERRTFQMFVDCYARYTSNVIHGVDDLAALVEKALLKLPSPQLDPLVQRIVLSSTGTDKDPSADVSVAQARLTFEVTYLIKGGVPDVAIR